MLRPTILIGIGSGGLRAIEFTWKLTQEIPDAVPANEKPIIRYIYLETDEKNDAVSPDIRPSSLTMHNTKASVKAVVDDINCTSSWLNGQQFPDNALSGAGGSPVFGRLCLWDQENRENFKKELMGALHSITSLSLEAPLVYVVGSFGGGTGSGTFLDIAYIIRDTLVRNVELQGLFMIPNYGMPDQVIYCNTICALKELDYYNQKHVFPFTWQANPPEGHGEENTPYDLVQIISSAYNEKLGTISYNQLQEDAGLFLYLNALGLYDTRRKSLVDATGNIIVTHYTTFGLSALHYPETEIKEIIANDLAKSLFERIIDVEHYRDAYNDVRSVIDTTTSIRNKVRSSFDEKFKKILSEWCDAIEVANSNSQIVRLDMHLRSLAEWLASGNYSYDDKRMELYKHFKVGGEYYNQLKTRCEVNATDRVIDLVIEEVNDALTKYHNVNLGITALETIKSSLGEIQNYWNSNGLTSEPQNWDTYLKNKIVGEVLPIPFDFKILFETENVYYDRLRFILLYGLAMHVFSESLSQIIKGIDGKLDNLGNRIFVKTTGGSALPSVVALKEKIDVVRVAIQNNDVLTKSCIETRTAIYEKLTKSTAGNIAYIYPEADLDATIQKALARYKQEHPNDVSIKDITESDDLYHFLMPISASNVLYNKVVEKYKSMIEIGNFSVAEAISESKNTQFIQNIAKKGIIPHVAVNPDSRDAVFKDHDKIPHVLLGYAGAQGNILSNIDKQLQGMGLYDFKINNAERETLSYVGLNNWLVFYKEFGYMSDSSAFNLIKDLRDFKNYASIYYAELQKNKIEPQLFHAKRMPYVSYENCIRQSNAYITIAIKFLDAKEYEEAIINYEYAMFWNMADTLAQGKILEIKNKLKNESNEEKAERYLFIADRYFIEQDFNTALYYYQRAEKFKSDNAYILSRRQQINEIKTQVRTFTDKGDELCEKAHVLYDQCLIEKDKFKASDCLLKYQDILNFYNQAKGLSAKDKEVDQKIGNIRRRVKNLENF